MNEETVISLGAETIKTMLLLSGPLLLTAMCVGLLVSIFQAITQINESTLTFIPKMIAMIVVLMVAAPWMMEVLTHYTTDIIGNAAEWIR